MKKTFQGTVFCVIVVLLSFAMSAGSIFAQQSNSLKENIQQTADYLCRLIDGDVTSSDGGLIVYLIQAGKDCRGLAEQLQKADWSELTFAQKALNAAAVKLAGGEADMPAFTEAVDLSSENPYNLCKLLPLLSDDDSELRQAVIAALKAYYNKESGNGFDYYGFSVDTNGLFCGALAPYAAEDAELAEMLADAFSYFNKVKSNAGYGYSEEYPEANASSTAGALTAYAAAGDLAAAQDAYEKLMAYASDGEKGAFEYGGVVSTFSTADALRALLDYSKIAVEQPTAVPTQTPVTTSEPVPTAEQGGGPIPTPTQVPNPETGIYFYTNGTAVYVAAILASGITVYMVRSRRKTSCSK